MFYWFSSASDATRGLFSLRPCATAEWLGLHLIDNTLHVFAPRLLIMVRVKFKFHPWCHMRPLWMIACTRLGRKWYEWHASNTYSAKTNPELIIRYTPSKHETLVQCSYDAGPLSTTLPSTIPALDRCLVFAGCLGRGCHWWLPKADAFTSWTVYQ